MILTLIPSDKLSEGLTITSSESDNPSEISSLFPKSSWIVIFRISTLPSALTTPTAAPCTLENQRIFRNGEERGSSLNLNVTLT